MRTREEQIASLAAAIYTGAAKMPHALKEAETYNLEAERRAEQRVRAEIGCDSERLDWLERQFKSCTVYMNGECSFSPSPAIRNLKGQSFRNAIDAAREAG